MVNEKTFVIADITIDREDWNHITLNTGKILSWHNALNITVSSNGRIALLGDCWQSEGDTSPSEEVSNAEKYSVEQILELEKYWCGRYVLIVDSFIYLDAGGLMSVFYTEGYASNSLNLLRELKNLPLRKEKIRRGTMPNFVPGPYTRYEGIYRQLPSYVLNYIILDCSFRELLPDGVITVADDSVRTEIFIDAFSNSLKNMFVCFPDKRKIIAVTGGRDSRATLSVLEKCGVDYDVCILEHGNISEADISISRKLSNALNRKHYYIPRTNSLSKDKIKKFDEHTCNYVVDQDRLFYGYSQYEQLKTLGDKDIVVIRSSVWARIVDKYTISNYKNLNLIYLLLRYNKQYRDSVMEWKDAVLADHGNQDISEGNRFFWEMREGCWLSSIEQAFALTEGVTSVQPLNCRYLLSILLGYEMDLRKDKKHEEMIVNAACPVIKDISYDYQITKKISRSAFRSFVISAKR